ncbi:dTDP-4-dehydrorhamnose 3,5-epimerase [Candidatus Dojkabacteria bacterium]|nr:dTDP-4-dehydrorhamnose 3,5-epimerase [Candidatus Dojkabacteria bacterium]
MQFEKFGIEGLVLIKPAVFEDARGFFLETYSKKRFKEEGGIDSEFVQDNHSRSSKGVLRGLHFQSPPFAQDKLLRVVSGEVLDVAVDIRKNSPTYGKWHSVVLSEKNKNIFFVPQGFAHGFLVLSETCDFEYKVSNYYSKESEGGVMWNDPDLAVEWGINDPIVSEKDSQNLSFKEFDSPFTR